MRLCLAQGSLSASAQAADLASHLTPQGCGRSKKEAEQACAHDALCYIAQIPGLGVPPPPPLKPPASWLSEASAQASSPSSHDAASAPSSDSGCRGDSGSEGGAGSAAPAPVFLARGPPVAAHASPGPATPAGSRSAPQPQLQQQQPTPADVDSMSADQLRTALCESLAREARLQAQVERLWQLLHVAVEGAPDHGQRDG